MTKPVCTIIAGPNGAGKTTFALQYLPKETRFINADLIASGLSPLSPELQQMKASRIFLKELEDTIDRKQNFAFVTMSLERVAERVKHGGHNIAKASIVRRYPRSLKNLIELYSPLCDTTICLDNSDASQKIIFIQEKSDRSIKDQTSYQELLKGIIHD